MVVLQCLVGCHAHVGSNGDPQALMMKGESAGVTLCRVPCLRGSGLACSVTDPSQSHFQIESLSNLANLEGQFSEVLIK